MTTNLPFFPSFDLKDEAGPPGPRWKKYISRFRNLIIALGITDKTRQRALLLHYAGEAVNDILDTLDDTEAEEGQDPLEKAILALTNYFEPKKNPAFEEYQFRQATQNVGEPIASYFTRLKQLAKTCEFADEDREIKSQIIQHCTSSKLRRKALSEPATTLQSLLEYGKTLEITEVQAASLEKQEVNRIHRCHGERSRKNRNGIAKPKDRGQWNETKAPICGCCGGTYPHPGGREACPAYKKECRNCGKIGHFQSVCRGKKQQQRERRPHRNVNTLEGNDDSDDENTFRLEVQTVNGKVQKQPRFKVKIDGTWIVMTADSGSSVNILDETDLKKMTRQPTLNVTSTRVYPYRSKTPLTMLGKFDADIATEDGKTSRETIYVTAGNGGSLLSWQTSLNLELISVATPLTSSDERPEINRLINEYSDLFTGLGKLKGFQVKLHIDETVQPVAQPHRRIPFHVRKQLERQLDRDEENGVIEKVEGPTPWVSPVVVAPKPKQPGSIRMCVDMRQANRAVQRERHITPTIKEVVSDLNGATIFTKLDLNQGYNQLELAPESRYITTFSTHVGLRRFARLNFGISCAAEIFQNAIRETLDGIPGAINLSDDILVYGKTVKDHDANLRKTFQRLREKGLTLHRGKCVYSKDRLEFFGYIFSKEGISADPKKVEAILNIQPPTNATEVRSLLGMSNYCSRFVKGYATITQPLRELTQKDTPWQWTTRHYHALAQLKEALSKAPVTAYFDPDRETSIYVDASPVGLGAILAQTDPATGHGKVIAYASRALTETESRYSQTEREALAVIWGCEYFHLYIYGKPATVITDHKPLVTIYNDPKSKPPARIERWTLRLQPYRVNIVYQKGRDNPADFMSRHPEKNTLTTSRQQKVAEEFVDYLATTSTPKAMKLDEIATATAQDPTLQAVIGAIRSGNWYQPSLHPSVDTTTFKAMERIKDELTVCSSYSVILRGTRIIVPETLQLRVVNLAHEGHQGIVKTKSLLREKVWFAGIDPLVEETVKSCLACQAATPETKREPLKMSPLPTCPWQELSVDFKEMSTGGYLLVVTDDYTRYPVVDVISTVSFKVVEPRLNKIFSEFGIPEVLRTDNGPPFNGKDFANFARTLGFKHRKVTPLWPRANGEVERFMRTIKKTVEAAKVDHQPWKEKLCDLLRNYRATPHMSTGVPPATALFNRPMRTKIPQVTPIQSVDRRIRYKDEVSKNKMKEHADKKSYVKPSNLFEGDKVLAKRDPSHKKSTTPYDPNPYVVRGRKGTMITARRKDREITRNSSFFKKVDDCVTVKQEADDNDDVPPESSSPTAATVPPNVPSRRYPLRSSRRAPGYLKDYV